MDKNKIKVLATGIGSLPHKDAESALDLIFKHLPNIPFWPQLPKRDVREGMVAQFSQNLPCLKVDSSGLVFDGRDKEAELERFYEHIIADDPGYFKISPEFALGLDKFYQRLNKSDLKEVEFIKGHITGPFTFAASITDENAKSLLYDDVFMQVILKGLSMKGIWQIELFKKFGKRMIIFLDEPYLGCFGSAYTPINREEVIKGLSEVTLNLKSKGALTGVHCCGNTDWSIFTEVNSIDIISFDAFSFLEKVALYAGDLKRFLQRGGMLCWGIVPTQDAKSQSADILRAKIREGISIFERKGVEPDLLLKSLLISPACGLGTLNAEESSKIFSLLSEMSNKLFDNNL